VRIHIIVLADRSLGRHKFAKKAGLNTWLCSDKCKKCADLREKRKFMVEWAKRAWPEEYAKGNVTVEAPEFSYKRGENA